MFNLNEGNRIVVAQRPTDMRMGVNGMCGQVGKVGLDPSNGDVYIFVGKSRTTMKLLHWERGGYVMYYKRLEQGRFLLAYQRGDGRKGGQDRGNGQSDRGRKPQTQDTRKEDSVASFELPLRRA